MRLVPIVLIIHRSSSSLSYILMCDIPATTNDAVLYIRGRCWPFFRSEKVGLSLVVPAAISNLLNAEI